MDLKVIFFLGVTNFLNKSNERVINFFTILLIIFFYNTITKSITRNDWMKIFDIYYKHRIIRDIRDKNTSIFLDQENNQFTNNT